MSMCVCVCLLDIWTYLNTLFGVMPGTIYYMFQWFKLLQIFVENFKYPRFLIQLKTNALKKHPQNNINNSL